MIPRVPSCWRGSSALLLPKERQLVITAHQGSDSCLFFHSDLRWTRSASPCTALAMALETWAQGRMYLPCSKQFGWQQSHPLYKRQQKERKSDMLHRTKPPANKSLLMIILEVDSYFFKNTFIRAILHQLSLVSVKVSFSFYSLFPSCFITSIQI